MAVIQLALYRIDGLDWGNLDPDQRQGTLARFEAQGLLGYAGQRYGLPEVRPYGTTVLGTFAHQTSESTTDYRETSGGLERVAAEIFTFEHYSFIIWFEEQIAALQRRRLPRTKALTTDEVERDFQLYLSEAALPATNRFVVLRPFGEESSEDDIRELLKSGRVVRLRIGNLAGRVVPDDVDLTNPRPDADEILHEYMNYDLRQGVDEVTLQADPKRQDANVAASFYAKGLVASGTVQEVEAIIADRRVSKIRENRQATIHVEEPITRDVAAMLLARILRAGYELAPLDDQPTMFGPELA